MTNHLVFFAFLIVVSGFFSLIEIQSEGQNGWAAKCPTWKIENQWTRKFFNGKPLTGYHLYFLLFMIFIAHLPYGLSFVPVSLANELKIISFLIFFFILEDFLWFVFNPAYGIRKFKSENIWWHAPNWWWIMPRDYWIFTPIAMALYILSNVL